MSTPKNPAAVALGKRRWAGKSKRERVAHARAMAARRTALIKAAKQAEKQALDK